MRVVERLLSHSTLLFAEACLCVVIILYVPYTEIDWKAYMQEVQGFLQGERNYVNLRGDTGPLVYPAGFVYIYSILHFITHAGEDVVLAQWIFAGFYLLTLLIVLKLYAKSGIPALYCVLLLLSKRVHSIFMLRLFNDGVAIMFLYFAVLLFVQNRWKLGCAVFSMAVSVKMNILLFSPGLLMILLKRFSIAQTAVHLTICAVIQFVLGAPFLVQFPVQYVAKAFELSRVFTYKWTVNYRFMREQYFLNPVFGLGLLAMTIMSWIWISRRRWSRRPMLTPSDIVVTLFESNLIGVIFARTLHYQFYSWFYHQLPLVMYLSTPSMPIAMRLIVLLLIEIAFNVYPSTVLSSSALMGCFFVLWAYMCFDADKAPGSDSRKRRHLIATRQ